MLCRDLDTNRIFLGELIARFGDPSLLRKLYSPDYLVYLAKAEADAQNQRDTDWIQEIRREVVEGRYHSSGSGLARILVPVAARHMGFDFAAVDFVPVGLLPSRTINGFVACGDHGECALVLDDCLLSSSDLLFRGLLGWARASPPQPTGAYAGALLALAAYNVSGDEAQLTKAWELLRDDPLRDDPQFEDSVDGSVLRVVLFLLLHEYAHLAMGHLDSGFLACGMFLGAELQVFSREQVQEFDADLQAVHWMLSLDASAAQRRALLLTVGSLMRFIDVCEHLRIRPVDTHPPAAERWSRIRSSVVFDEVGALDLAAVAAWVDEPFDFLLALCARMSETVSPSAITVEGETG